jgi:hypothetical protein
VEVVTIPVEVPEVRPVEAVMLFVKVVEVQVAVKVVAVPENMTIRQIAPPVEERRTAASVMVREKSDFKN